MLSSPLALGFKCFEKESTSSRTKIEHFKMYLAPRTATMLGVSSCAKGALHFFTVMVPLFIRDLLEQRLIFNFLSPISLFIYDLCVLISVPKKGKT